ncbi:hypothetical protein, partial [Acinetobacter baumannii]|uniref:hypothetical protein n=1 Tax=Acinetobacter baumannii TaxID=470 RepID=UPI001C09AF8B
KKRSKKERLSAGAAGAAGRLAVRVRRDGCGLAIRDRSGGRAACNSGGRGTGMGAPSTSRLRGWGTGTG